MSYITNTGRGNEIAGLDFAKLTEQYAKITIRELTTGTAGVSFAQLVAVRAAIQMLTKKDAREFCRLEMVPSGGGLTYHFQKLKAVAGGTLTEGTDLAPTDLTPSDITALVKTFAEYTAISDLLQRQAAVNYAEVVGKAHGNAMINQVNLDVYATLKLNAVSKATLAGAGAQAITWASLWSAIQLVESQRFAADTFLTSPFKFYEFIQSNVASVQFYAALQDLLRTGKIPEIIGQQLFIDQNWGETFTGAVGEKYGMVLQSNEAEGFAQAWDVTSEIQRWAVQVGFRVVTSLSGKSALVVDEAVASIEHA